MFCEHRHCAQGCGRAKFTRFFFNSGAHISSVCSACVFFDAVVDFDIETENVCPTLILNVISTGSVKSFQTPRIGTGVSRVSFDTFWLWPFDAMCIVFAVKYLLPSLAAAFLRISIECGSTLNPFRCPRDSPQG